MSVYDNSDQAWCALLQFVDNRWIDRCNKCGLPALHDAEEWSARFSAEPGDRIELGTTREIHA